MITVLFGNRHGEKREIARAETIDVAKNAITKFLEEHHFHSYYWIVNETKDGDLWIDVSSHSEFFWLHDDNKKLTIKDLA
mgnify:CR=1 FL=1